MATRSDKKFLVKLWVRTSKKTIFRMHCVQHHVSMMKIGEEYVKKALAEFNDSKIREIIDANHPTFISMKSTKDDYETLGIRLINDYWQKLGYFAVMYKTSVSKIASCIFEYSLSAYEMRDIFETHGLTFKKKKIKKKDKLLLSDFHNRLSER